MPPDPNDKMDDLLKAYAARRREQSGAPFELHPATRSLLQGEVAKLAPRAQEKRAKTSFLGRFIFSAAAAVSIAICAVILLNNPKHAAPVMPLAHNNETSNIVAASGSVALQLPGATLSAPGSVLSPDEGIASTGLPEPLTRAVPVIAATPVITNIRLANNFTVTATTNSYDAQNLVDNGALAKAGESSALPRDTALRNGITLGAESDVKKADVVVTYNTTTAAGQGYAASPGNAAISNSMNGATFSLNSTQTVSGSGTIGGATAVNGNVALNTDQADVPLYRGGNGGENLTTNNSANTMVPAPAAAATQQSAERHAAVELKPAGPQAATADQSLASNNADQAMVKKAGPTRALAGGKEVAAQDEKQKEEKMATPGVLTTFQLEMTGDNVRLIDADGSTYYGKINQPLLQKQLAVLNGRTFTNLAPVNQFNYADNLKMQQADAAKNSQQKFGGAAGGFGAGAGGNGNVNAEGNGMAKQDALQQQQQLQQNFFFRAVGTSRKLKKIVTFEGNYIAADVQQAQDKELPPPGAGQAQGQGHAGKSKLALEDENAGDNKSALLPVDNNARIQGRAQVGDETVDVDAIVIPLKTKAAK